MHFIDQPHFVSKSTYEDAIAHMLSLLSTYTGVHTVFQIGGVTSPGISDIDLLVVFEDNHSCHRNPRETLPTEYKYLFTHGLYGVSQQDFIKAQQFTFFHNYQQLWGSDLQASNPHHSETDISQLKVQTALEYMITMFIYMTIERTYGISKLRNLLLHAKAILYDLEFFQISSGPLYDHVNQLIEWRSTWFSKPPGAQTVATWITDFYQELRLFLEKRLSEYTFHYPNSEGGSIAANITITPGDSLRIHHSGWVFPATFARLGRKYFNLQHRFNQFDVFLPLTKNNLIPDIVAHKFLFVQSMKDYNRVHLPYFMPTASRILL